MSFDFERELQTQPQQAQQAHSPKQASADDSQALDSVMEWIDEEPQEITEEEIDDQLQDVQKRLEIATHFKLLLEDHLFTPPVSEAGLVVEKIVRKFIADQLKVLLGISPQKKTVSPQPAELPFSPEQIGALAAIADKVLDRSRSPSPPSQPPEAPEPTVQSAQPTPRGPQLKKKESLPPRQAPRRARPVASQVASRLAPPEPPPGDPEGIVEHNGRRYKKHVRSDGKVVMMDITGQVQTPSRIPMPGWEAQNGIMQQHAIESVRIADARLSDFGSHGSSTTFASMAQGS